MWLYVPETPPEVTPDDLAVLSLYTGSAMLDEALAAGWEELTGRRTVTVGRCERDAYAAAGLVERMEEEALGRAPIWDDSRTFPCRTFRKKVGAVTAGFPCQPWSNAGARLGIQDPRWLWPDIARIIRGVGAGIVLLENVPPLLCDKAADEPGWRYPPGAWFVLRDLAKMGFDAEWCVVSASGVGAAHERQRWFLLALHHSLRGRWEKGDDNALRAGRQAAGVSGALRDSDRFRRLHEGTTQGRAKRHKTCNEPASSGTGSVSDSKSARDRRLLQERETRERSRREMFAPGPHGWGPLWDTPLAPAVESGVCVLVDGVALVVDASRTDQLRVSGNGVVALEAAVATVILGRRLGI